MLDPTTDLNTKINSLQAAFEQLESRIGEGERLTDRLEQEARQLRSLEASGGLQRSSPADASYHAGSPVGHHQALNVQRLLNQLETSEQRLSNQEQAIQTIAMVIQSMVSSLDLPGEASSSHRGETDAASRAMAGIREIANSSRSAMSLQGDVAYYFPDGQSSAQGSAPHAGGSDEHFQDFPGNMGGHEEEFPSLQRNGEQSSNGSKNHPDLCRPCAFYCFSKRGCKKGLSCEYCHMLHISRSNRRILKADNSNPSRRRQAAPKGFRPGPRQAMGVERGGSSSTHAVHL